MLETQEARLLELCCSPNLERFAHRSAVKQMQMPHELAMDRAGPSSSETDTYVI